MKSQAALRRVRVGRRLLNGVYLAISTWVIVASLWQITVDTFGMGPSRSSAPVSAPCADSARAYEKALEHAWKTAHEGEALLSRYEAELASQAGTAADVAAHCRGSAADERAELALARLASGQSLAIEQAKGFPLADLRTAVAREIPNP